MFTSTDKQASLPHTEAETPFTSVTAALLCNDIEETLESIFKRHDFLNGSIAFGELLKQQQTLLGMKTEIQETPLWTAHL